PRVLATEVLVDLRSDQFEQVRIGHIERGALPVDLLAVTVGVFGRTSGQRRGGLGQHYPVLCGGLPVRLVFAGERHFGLEYLSLLDAATTGFGASTGEGLLVRRLAL